MLGYTCVGTNDLPKALSYYEALMADLGPKMVMEDEGRMRVYSNGQGGMLMVTKPADGQPATVGNGCMIALPAGSREGVDALYKKAMELGSADEGGPGERMPGFYGAYFRDLDGNKICAFHMG
ncbi:VOC family protein [Pyruvatibacter mobilis]|jgi:predicted lactoylglutathione lyase|uniref:VOC family protein n=1 Tax=Pyruvatibacter mobilis TaxID=1712261 RepID=UPI003BA89CB1